MVAQVLERLDVGLHALDLRVGDEDDAIDTLEDELAGGVVEDLAGHRVEVEAGLEAADLTEREGRKSKNSVRSVSVLSETILPFGVGVGLVVDVLQVRRLAAQTGTVVDDLAVDLPGSAVDESHRVRRAPLFVKQVVDVLVGDLGEDRLSAGLHRSS